MPDYDNTNSGVLFRNEEKTSPASKWPDHKGQAEICCPHCNRNSEHWLSAWIKTAGQNARNPGSKFFSLAFTWKDQQGPKTGKSEQQKQGDPEEGFDDIPF